jgi:hypothetical protein
VAFVGRTVWKTTLIKMLLGEIEPVMNNDCLGNQSGNRGLDQRAA